MSEPRRWPVIPALLLTVTAAVALWRWLGQPVSLPDVPGDRLQCLSYTPFTPGESGVNGPGFASAERIARDLDVLGEISSCLRIYSATGNGPRILRAADQRNLKVLVGAWIGRNRQQNSIEIEAALKLAEDFPHAVAAIVVGNEVLLRREMPGEELAGIVRAVKARSSVPVAYADVTRFITDHPAVANAADLVMIHILPYWEDPRPRSLDELQAQLEATLAEVRAKFPGKEIMVGETGLPSAGPQRGPVRPGLVNEARYVRVLALRAARLGLRYNLVEAIDQPWKRTPEGTVGGHWGILDEQREPKFSLTGPVSEWPRWREAAGFTAAIAGVVLLPGVRRPGLRTDGWVLLSVLGVTLGTLLVYQWNFASATSVTLFGWAGGLAAAAMAVASVVMLLPLARRQRPGPAAPLAALAMPLKALASRPGWRALFALACALPAAYVSLTLAFEPRYLDVPIAYFMLPALCLTLRYLAGRPGGAAQAAAEFHDRREEAMLAALLVSCGFAQLEWGNLETAAWCGICLLIAIPWLPALGAEIRRLRHDLPEPDQAQRRQQHTEGRTGGGI